MAEIHDSDRDRTKTDRIYESSEEERLEARNRVRSSREPVGYQNETERAFGGLYLFLIVLAIVILTVALVAIVL